MSQPGVSSPASLRHPGRTIARAAGLVMALFILSRLTGLARQIIVGALFGTSPAYDAYVAAFRLPDMLFQLVAGGALVSALLPTYTTVRTREGTARGWQLVSEVATLVIAILIGAAVLIALFARPLVAHILVPEFSPSQQALTASLLRVLLLSTVIFGASGLSMSVLNAHQHFFLPALAPVLYNVGIIFGAVVLGPRWGVHGLAWGVVVGAAMHFGVQIPGLARVGMRFQPALSVRDPAVRNVLRLMGPRVLGLAAVQVNFLVNTILASGLSAGSLSALDYAFRVMLLPLGIFAQAVATAAFPTFAQQVAEENLAGMRHTLARLVRAILFLTIPAAVGLILLAHPLVVVLFQRQAFDETSTRLTVMALQAYAVGLVGHALVEILARAFYSLYDTRTPVSIGLSAMALNVALNVWWVRVWGHTGLALANSVATLLEAGALYLILHKRIGGLVSVDAAVSMARQLTAAATMGALLWGLSLALRPWGAFVWLIGGMTGGGLAYVGSTLLLGSDEVTYVLRMAKERFKQS